MNVKVLCPCGAKFAFDVEPLNGAMPVALACPTCGEDATPLANKVIQQQLASETTPPRRPRAIAPDPPTPAPPAPAKRPPPLRLSIPTPQAPTAETQPETESAHGQRHSTPRLANAICLRHDGRRATDSCRVCGKPICPQCLAVLGYVCSPYCKQRAEAEGIELPIYHGHRTVVEKRFQKKVRGTLLAGIGVVALLIGATAFYSFYLVKPRIQHRQAIHVTDYTGGICRFLDDNTYLSVAGDQIALFESGSGKERWLVHLREDPEGTNDGFRSWVRTALLDARHDVWLLSDRTVRCLDRQTGEIKHRVVLEESTDDYAVTEDGVAFLLQSYDLQAGSRLSAVHIDFASGQVERESLPTPRPAERGESSSTRYIAAGPGIVELRTKLLQVREEVVERIKTPTSSIMDSGQLSGANAVQAMEELMNEMARDDTGGRETIDVSLYQVNLLRHLSAAAAEWSGQVEGSVTFYPMRTVDLLVAGTTLHVFDKQNQLKWTAKLTFPVGEEFRQTDEPPTPPALLTATTLYFFDKGMLTAFDISTGTPRWRVTSVGIRQVQQDAQGDLYVTTTTANAESIQYSEQISLMDRPKDVLMKVADESGEILWTTTMAGEGCIVTGDFLYGSLSKMDFISLLHPDQEATTHFRIYRLDPDTGQRLWEYYQPQSPVAMDLRKNNLLLQFTNELQFISYTAL